MRCLEIKRQMASSDIASVSELLDAAARADGRRPLSDHLYLDLVNGGLDGFAGFLASEPGHDHPVAYAQISRGNDAHAFELVIHPHHRYEMATIGPELIEAALDVIASDGGGRVNWWVFEPTTDARPATRRRSCCRRVPSLRRRVWRPFRCRCWSFAPASIAMCPNNVALRANDSNGNRQRSVVRPVALDDAIYVSKPFA